MKPAPFTYHKATTLSDATDLLAKLENARLLAGGQSLVPMMNMRYVLVDHLIDINDINELSGVRIINGRVTIGAMTRQRDILTSKKLAQYAPIFAEALRQVGHLQTRNRGTIGGSLSHLDPAAELPGLISLHDASIALTNKDGSRTVSMEEFATAYMTPCMEVDEILTNVSFDIWPHGHGYDFREFSRRHGDFAVVGVGSLMTLSSNKRIEKLACVLIGTDYRPIRLKAIERDLVGQLPSEDLFRDAGEETRQLDMLEDALIPASYRKQLASVLLRRSLLSSAQRATGEFNA